MITRSVSGKMTALLLAMVFVFSLSGCSYEANKGELDLESKENSNVAISSAIEASEEKILFILVTAKDGADINPYIKVVQNETNTVLNLDEYVEDDAFHVAKIDNGVWTVTAECEGYVTKTATLTVSDDNSLYYARLSLESNIDESENDSNDTEDGTDSSGTDSNESGIHEDSIPPEDALEYNGHYYKVYDISTTWDEAEAQCELLGGHLVSVTTQEEQEFLEDNIYQENHDYWLGGFYDAETGTWAWITGESMTYYAWNESPSEEDSAEHTYMGVSDLNWQFYNEEGKWYYSQSNYRYIDGFICEWDSAELEGDEHDINDADDNMLTS